MLHELFAAHTELLYRGVETGVLEGYSNIASKQSSAIVAASSLGYSVRRPVPASSSFYVAISGSSNSYAGAFTIPRLTQFTVNGIPFVTLDDYTFKWDSTGKVIAPETGTQIVQGSLVTAQFNSVEGKFFQSFTIADPSFSEYFGESDPLSDLDPSMRLTTVNVDGVYWDIDRRTLYSSDKSTAPYTKDGSLIKSRNYKCLIQTNAESNIEVKFGDGIISAIPSGKITVTYLSTNGNGGNIFNSKDLEINIVGNDISYDPINSLNESNIKFFLNESAIGGADFESIQSIKNNAPKIYSALDRAVTIDDYKAILLTMPNVSHALAFGEDQLAAGDYRYFNTVLYTAINRLYTGSEGSYRPSTPSEYILSGYTTLDVAQGIQDAGTATSNIKLSFDSKFDLSSLTNDISTQVTYNQYVNSLGSIFRLSKQNIDSASELGYIDRTLRKKGIATVRHIYFPSKVHKYRAKIEVFVTPISNKNSIANSIQQKTYSYLSDNTHFNYPIYSSKLIKIIEGLNSIVGCHVSFEPQVTAPNLSAYIDTILTESTSVIDDLIDSLNKVQLKHPEVALFPEFTLSGNVGKSAFMSSVLKAFTYGAGTLVNENKLCEKNIANFINYVWENTLGRMILNPYVVNGRISSISDFVNSQFNKSIETGGLVNTDINESIYDTFIRWAV
jgi:hypothetical protein